MLRMLRTNRGRICTATFPHVQCLSMPIVHNQRDIQNTLCGYPSHCTATASLRSAKRSGTQTRSALCSEPSGECTAPTSKAGTFYNTYLHRIALRTEADR